MATTKDPPIISVFSFKGGVGKTTITANLCATLAVQGWRVLAVDGDPQTNLTGCLERRGATSYEGAQSEQEQGNDCSDATQDGDWGIWDDPIKPNPDEEGVLTLTAVHTSHHLTASKLLRHVYDVGTHEDAEGPSPVLKQTPALINGYYRFGLIQGTPEMAKAAEKLSSVSDKARIAECFRHTLKDIGQEFDFIFIDLPPAISELNKMCLCSSDFILMPVKPDNFSADTLLQMFDGSNCVFKKDLRPYMNAAWPEDQLFHTVKLLPLVLNMCDRGPTTGSRIPGQSSNAGAMSKDATKWYNGFCQLMGTVSLPRGFDFAHQDKRVIGGFLTCGQMHYMQLERLPAMLFNSLSTVSGLEMLRKSCTAICNMLIAAADLRLGVTNPLMMDIFHGREHGCFDTLKDRAWFYQLPLVMKGDIKLPCNFERDNVDKALVEIVYHLATCRQSFDNSPHPPCTLQELLDADVNERTVCKFLDTFCRSSQGQQITRAAGYTLDFSDGRRPNLDFRVIETGDSKKVVAQMEAKWAKTPSNNASKDLGYEALKPQVKNLKDDPRTKTLAAYGISFQLRSGYEARACSLIVLWKHRFHETEDGKEHRLEAFACIPVWGQSRHRLRTDGEAGRSEEHADRLPASASKRKRETADAAPIDLDSDEEVGHVSDEGSGEEAGEDAQEGEEGSGEGSVEEEGEDAGEGMAAEEEYNSESDSDYNAEDSEDSEAAASSPSSDSDTADSDTEAEDLISKASAQGLRDALKQLSVTQSGAKEALNLRLREKLRELLCRHTKKGPTVSALRSVLRALNEDKVSGSRLELVMRLMRIADTGAPVPTLVL
jgi:cellulose biosynthesis protein BcsQ